MFSYGRKLTIVWFIIEGISVTNLSSLSPSPLSLEPLSGFIKAILPPKLNASRKSMSKLIFYPLINLGNFSSYIFRNLTALSVI